MFSSSKRKKRLPNGARYKLLGDTIQFYEGAIFEECIEGFYLFNDDYAKDNVGVYHRWLNDKQVIKNPSWFQKIENKTLSLSPEQYDKVKKFLEESVQ